MANQPKKPEPKKQSPGETSLFRGRHVAGKDVYDRLRQYNPPGGGYTAGLRDMPREQRATHLMKKFGLDYHGHMSDLDRHRKIEELKRTERSSSPDKHEAGVLREILEKQIR